MENSTTTRVAVVTGASSGIGKATATALARMGWRVIGTGRNPARCDAAEADIREASSGGKVDMLRGDFELMADVARIADEIAMLTDRVDVLVNNAGNMRDEVRVTPEGLEITFASNHLAAFLLTKRLMPLLRNAASNSPAGTVRVLAVSSSGHEVAPPFDWDDLQMIDAGVEPGRPYCLAKLANILFTRELGRRVVADGIITQAMHPGVVDSNFVAHTNASTRAYMQTLEGHSPEEAAKTLVWMATSPECGAPSGRYFHQLAEVPASDAAQNDADAARLWEESDKLLAGLGY